MDITSIARSGMDGAQRTLETAARRITRSDPSGGGAGLSADMLALLEARNQFAANAQVVRTADYMQKRLIDLVG